MHRLRRYVFFLSALLLTTTGCTHIRPIQGPLPVDETSSHFSHDAFDRVLQRFVTEEGRVDYAALKRNSADLDRYYRLLASASPDSHPHLFPTRQSRLAYWINAYNAAVIKLVITYYPIASVLDIRPPKVLFFMPEESGFFFFQKVVLGQKPVSLYTLENTVIRKRFREPRIHFALNCASSSCPKLLRQAFSAGFLDRDLNRAARDVLTDAKHLKIDHEKKVVYLSKIFDWYRDDFLNPYRRAHPGKDASLVHAVMSYVPLQRVEELKRAVNYNVRFFPYDWRLNDRS